MFVIYVNVSLRVVNTMQVLFLSHYDLATAGCQAVSNNLLLLVGVFVCCEETALWCICYIKFEDTTSYSVLKRDVRMVTYFIL